MNLTEFEAIERAAKLRRVNEMRRLFEAAIDAVIALFADEPRRVHPLDHAAERFMGLANFQDRLKNSRPPRIAFIRSTNRSKCSGTSTKFRRSLFTMSSGLSE